MRKRWLAALLPACLIFVVSCDKEQDDLAKAQDCLDNVNQSTPSEADKCLTYIDKYDTQQAKILKCSIYMTSGGLVENKLVNAYKALKSSTLANKSAAFMATMSLDYPDVPTAYTKAKSADVFCQASGVPGLQYISSIVLGGTALNNTIASLPSGAAIDITNPAAVDAAVNSMLTQCTDPAASTTVKETCQNNIATLGDAAQNLSGQYCGNTGADQDVCSAINKSAEGTGGDPAKVGQALLCYLKNVNYNPATNECI